MQNKISRRRNRIGLLLIPVVALFFTHCTKDFGSTNTDSTKLSAVGNSEYPYMFSYALMTSTYSYNLFETAVGTYGLVYSQFFSQAALSFPTDRYVIRQDWLPSYWNPVYTQAVPQLKTILTNTDAATAENALASIWWVWVFHRTTDYTGPVPYFDAGSGKSVIAFTPQDSIYYDLFKKLDAAIAVLKNHPGEKPFGNFDLVYKSKSGGTTAYWRKFANSLKLRLAMRISRVKPDLAKKYAEEAVADGVMLTNDDDAYVPKTAAATLEYNGMSTIGGWNEVRMSASMESILKGYNDPRIAVYFQPASSTGTYEGVRNGLYQAEKTIQINSKPYSSNMGKRWVTGSDQAGWLPNYAVPNEVMMAAECYFLRAEGALNGWNMSGDAGDLYATGIQKSMEQWGITDQSAITVYIGNAATPIEPADGQNSAAVNDYPVLWSADPVMQRKQIAQQKWLALFPDGMEGWAEVRRSGYPQLYPVVHSDNADLPAGTRIRRLPFITSEVQTNAAAVAAAVTMLNGPDNAATPLWWDKN